MAAFEQMESRLAHTNGMDAFAPKLPLTNLDQLMGISSATLNLAAYHTK